MSTDREQILSEFVDAWNAGRRPDADDYLARVHEADRDELAAELTAFLRFAPSASATIGSARIASSASSE